ncbi:Uncharacterized protein OBRU01_19198 [Operophtera brumata]|uniref:Zinc finger matrin-type protein n=1 Tax=Operophtera brumata TaxID=104452 RepID=A0A0L7KVM4_OPEBR|nr:Uncharacterized protein OBRU01_19198 [Operophtera brumata]
MSHDSRKSFYDRDRDRHGSDRRAWGRPESYRENRDPRLIDPRDRGDRSRKRSRSISRSDIEKRRHSPRKNDKDMIDDNILSEISKLPEPSELWENPSSHNIAHYTHISFTKPPNPSYTASYQPSYSGIYDDFPPTASGPPTLMPDMASWNQMSLPPPPGPHATYQNAEDQMKKEASLETERHLQKSALSKQREDYIKKASILKKEMDTLKDQRNELRGDPKRSPSPDTKRFLKENTKLQLEIQNKLKTITNVVDMLNGIIGEEATDIHDSDDSPDRKRKSRSPSNKKFNYVYYDPEMHWCRVCNEFPPTAKDYLNHLHSAAHHKMAAAHMEAPWHTVTGMNEGYPSFPSAPAKRTPIRGLQFFVPSTAWYCKLCDQFIGDLHCASAHLKSITHSKNYINFVEQNPHWETDWMSDRQKAFEKARATLKNKPPEEKPQYTPQTITFSKDGFHTKRKKSPTPPVEEKKKKKDKKKTKKKKRDSSSSSSSDSSSEDSDAAKKKLKKSKKLKNIEEMDDKALEEWMTTIKTDKLTDSDRKLLDNLKTNERRDVRRDKDKSPDKESKKPEIKKMPFIGKMPVYKQLAKSIKTEETKKEEEKKKEEEGSSEKKKAEMDAEIQRKVAEFKEKIARAQQEREAQMEQQLKAVLPPPTLVQVPVPPPP